MAYSLWIEYPGAFYYVSNRRIDRCEFFRDRKDRERQGKKRTGTLIS
jgi:hypothetical protein